MAFEKSPPWLIELFAELLASTPGEWRQMFGCPVGFLGGNLFCGLFGASMFVRLGEADRARLLALEGARVFDPMARGKGMSQYIVLPTSVLDEAREARDWLGRAATYARSLPEKKPKQKTAARRSPAKPAPKPGKKPARKTDKAAR